MKRGPKTGYDEAMERKNLCLDQMTIRKLMVLGDGNLSAGVRLAAAEAYNLYQRGRITVGTKQGASDE